MSLFLIILGNQIFRDLRIERVLVKINLRLEFYEGSGDDFLPLSLVLIYIEPVGGWHVCEECHDVLINPEQFLLACLILRLEELELTASLPVVIDCITKLEDRFVSQGRTFAVSYAVPVIIVDCRKQVVTSHSFIEEFEMLHKRTGNGLGLTSFEQGFIFGIFQVLGSSVVPRKLLDE